METAGTSINVSGLTLNTGANGSWSWTQNAITVGAQGNPSGAFVAGQLASRNFSLDALGGDLIVNDAVCIGRANTNLTLASLGNININAPITVDGATAGLVMNYGGYNGTSVTTRQRRAPTTTSSQGKLQRSSARCQRHSPGSSRTPAAGVYGSINFTNSSNLNGCTSPGRLTRWCMT